MKKLLVALTMGLLVSLAHATDDPVYQKYIHDMVKGGNSGIKQTAESIYNSGVKDREVLDVAMEVLLQNYRGAPNSEIDTLAWVAKAIGQSGDNRYSSALKVVVEGETHKKLVKYAKHAWKDVGTKPSVEQYVKGSVNLAAMQGSAKQQAAAKPRPKPQSTASGAKPTGSLQDVHEGMGMQEVYALIGFPTNTTTHQTGKAWIPFNFGGKDLARTIALYKGQGRVVFSHSAYQSDSKVLEVIVDPEETGVP